MTCSAKLTDVTSMRTAAGVHGLFVSGEAGPFIIEGLLDRLLGQRVRKGKTGSLKKRGQDQSKSF